MSAQGSTSTSKVEEKKNGEPAVEKKPAAQLEEDDEFEDFPIEGIHWYTLKGLRM
jgi:26 proteasome complex subunit DSS1